MWGNILLALMTALQVPSMIRETEDLMGESDIFGKKKRGRMLADLAGTEAVDQDMDLGLRSLDLQSRNSVLSAVSHRQGIGTPGMADLESRQLIEDGITRHKLQLGQVAQVMDRTPTFDELAFQSGAFN